MSAEPTRRTLLTGGVGALGLAVGVAAGAGGARALDGAPIDSTAADRLKPANSASAGRALPRGLPDRVPAFGTLLSFDLAPDARREPKAARAAATAFLKRVSALADGADDPDAAASLDLRPASLQVTPGVGGSLLDALAVARPDALADLPAFPGDKLQPELSGGDLMVQVGAEDPLKLAGAVQAVTSYAARTGGLVVRWSRPGFRSTAAGAQNPGTTARNLMGHRDGTDNPALGSPLWHSTVTARDPGWMAGGSYLVARQILIDLDTWFGHDQAARDRVIGRRTGDGAPLGGRHEHDQVDLQARSDGAHVIPDDAHIRLASTQNTGGARIYRRAWNFDDGYVAGERRAGLLFLAWQADPREGFVPIQQTLASRHDALNTFTTHVGSAVFAVPAQGGDNYVGQRLLEGS